MILRDRYAELSLDGWDAANGGIVGPATRDGDRERGGRGAAGKGSEGGETATAAIVAKIELVEDELPGGDAVDVTVSSSNDRKVRVVFCSFSVASGPPPASALVAVSCSCSALVRRRFLAYPR